MLIDVESDAQKAQEFAQESGGHVMRPPKDRGRPAEPDARQSDPNIKTTAR